jgi:hypothetical protein
MAFRMFTRNVFKRPLVIAAAAMTCTTSAALLVINTNMKLGNVQESFTSSASPRKEDDKKLQFRKKWEQTVKDMQQLVCSNIEKVDGKGKFRLDEWKRPEGGGGWTKVLTDGHGMLERKYTEKICRVRN